MEMKPADRFVLWKHWARIWLKVIRFFLTTNPVTVVRLFRRHPWIKGLLGFNDLYFNLCRGREGRYLKATALTVEGLATGVLDSVLGTLTHPRQLILTEEILSTEIFRAMGLKPFRVEDPPFYLSMVTPSAVAPYIDHAENWGIPPDICSAIKNSIGTILQGQLPDGLAVITSNTPCDSHMGSYTVMESQIERPMYRLDVPYQVFSERATDYFVDELKGMISWLETNTPGRMDWDRLRAICEERNRTAELHLDLWEALRVRPAPMAGEPVYLSYWLGAYVRPGEPDSTRLIEQVLALARQNLNQDTPALPHERHRALCWNSPVGHFLDLFNWAERAWGVTLVMESLAFNRIPLIDTETPDSMLRGLARVVMAGPMARHTRGPAENYLTDIFYVCKTYDIDMLWVGANIGCKKTAALHGILRERCREKEIPLLIIEMDVMDPRTVSHERIMEQIDDFMENTMEAEPLDVAGDSRA